jgi:MSHA pilin protein MshD
MLLNAAFTRGARWRRSFDAPLGNQRGLTFLELVFLLVIAAIVLPGLMIYFTEGMQHNADAQLNTVAAGLAQELIEEIKTKKWDEHSPIPMSCSGFSATCYSAVLGPDGTESRCDPTVGGCKSYNDVDDYNNLNNNPPKDPQGNPLPAAYAAYRQQVSVCYVSAVQPVSGGGSGADAGVCVAGPTDYKKITVTIFWGTSQQTQLQAVVANYQVS